MADSIDLQWLAPPQRTITRKGVVARYLKDTNQALSKLQHTTRVIPLATDRLTGMTTAVVTAINLIADLFPSIRSTLREGGEHELCGKLRTVVLERPRILEYWQKYHVDTRPWGITEYSTAEWIAKEASLHEVEYKL